MAIYLPSIRQRTQGEVNTFGRLARPGGFVFRFDRAAAPVLPRPKRSATLGVLRFVAQANHVATSSHRKRAMFRTGTPEEKSNDRDWISAAGKRSRPDEQSPSEHFRLRLRARERPILKLRRNGVQLTIQRCELCALFRR